MIKGWVTLAEAPVDVVGLVWGPTLGERVEFTGRVYEYLGGSRNATAAGLHGVKLTHWHPLPLPPEKAAGGEG